MVDSNHSHGQPKAAGALREQVRTPSIDEGSKVHDKASIASWLSLALLIATILFALVDRQIIALVAAPMAQSLSLSDVQLGMIQGLGLAFFAAVAAFPLGWLVDRYDRRLVLGACVFAWGLGTAACGLAQNFHQLMIATIVLAAAEVGVGPVIYAVMPELFQNHRQRITANQIYFVASILAQSAGYLIGGLVLASIPAVQSGLPALFQSLEAWRLGFLLVAMPAPIFVLLIAMAKLNGTARNTPSVDVSRGGQPDLRSYLKAHWRALALVFLSVGAFFFANACALVWLPAALAREFGVSPASSGVMIGMVTGVGVVSGTLISAFVIRCVEPRLGRRAPFRIGAFSLLFSGVIALGFTMVTQPWQAFVLLGVQMATATTVGSLTPTIIQEISPANLRGRIAGLQSIILLPLAGLSIMSVGVVASLVGPRTDNLLLAITIVGVPAWLLAAVLMRLSERPFSRTVQTLADSGT